MAVPGYDFLSRILGNQPSAGPVMAPTPTAAAVAAPTMQQAQQQDFNNAMLGRMGQLGMLFLAAGQKLTPAQRATILAQAPQYMDGVQADMYNAAQARYMDARQQEAMKEQERQDAIRAKLADPKVQSALGMKPEMIDVLGVDGVKKMLVDQMQANTPDAQLDRRYKQAQIDHLLAPPTRAEPTPQLVDLPGGGKGWAKPGTTDVIPIGGAGKGGVDPEMAKRTEAEDKNLTYAKEAIAAHKILSDPTYYQDLASGYKARVNKIPALNGSWAGDKYLTGDAQANSFVDSVVRPRSGAVVGPTEMADKKRIFTPMPGDAEAQFIQKAQMRAQHIQSLIAGANPADRPMLQKMYEESLAELQGMAAGSPNNAQSGQRTLPPGVRSITPVGH